jgi:UPF0716 protein FxsA
MMLFLAFLAIPLIEIALFIQIGGAIGLVWTLLIVIATAVIGASMVRAQGTAVLQNLQRSLSEVRDPSEPLAHGAMILFAGALLLTPGFFTDFIGFALLVPQVRERAFAALRKRMNVQTFAAGPQNRPDEGVIDGDFVELDPSKVKRDGPSGWTKDQ